MPGTIIRLILSDKANKMTDVRTRILRAEEALEYFLKRHPDWECDVIYASGSALKARIDSFLEAASLRTMRA